MVEEPSDSPVAQGENESLARSPGRLKRGSAAARQRYEGSSAEHLWQRLNALDFMNQAMQFAALLLLAFLPFLIVVSSLAGHNAASTVARHLGLNHQATQIVYHVFTPASRTAAVLNIRGIAFAVFGGLCTAATLQALYERVHNLPSRGMKDFHRQLVWVGSVLAVSFLAGWVLPKIRSVAAGPVLLGIVAFVLAFVFWFFTMWLLLAGRRPWHELVRPALATAACWVGLGVFSKFFFSNTVIGDFHEYGAVGVTFAIMSWMIAVGVVIILGSVVGAVWQESHLSFSAAFKRLLRSRRRQTTAGAGEIPAHGAGSGVGPSP